MKPTRVRILLTPNGADSVRKRGRVGMGGVYPKIHTLTTINQA